MKKQSFSQNSLYDIISVCVLDDLTKGVVSERECGGFVFFIHISFGKINSRVGHLTVLAVLARNTHKISAVHELLVCGVNGASVLVIALSIAFGYVYVLSAYKVSEVRFQIGNSYETELEVMSLSYK